MFFNVCGPTFSCLPKSFFLKSVQIFALHEEDTSATIIIVSVYNNLMSDYSFAQYRERRFSELTVGSQAIAREDPLLAIVNIS